LARSMTGYGRGEDAEGGYRFIVELKAVNHRHFDLVIRASRDLSPLEDMIRQILQEKISRGRVEAYVYLETNREKRENVAIDEELAASYLQSLQKLSDSFHLPEGKLTAVELARFPDVLYLDKTAIDPHFLHPVLESAVKKAVAELFSHRLEEGHRLELDILQRLEKLENITEIIEERGPQFLEEYQRKLSLRLEELHDGKEYDKQRFFTEIALFAERCNIDEEIIRMKSHLHTLSEEIVKDRVMGRKLDFLLQEMNREVNTIAAKSNDLTISQFVVEAKSEIEKIREQVQNIE
jgi:uncharacterized protein (TIGR00255 family)